VANHELKLVQTRLPPKVHKKLVKAQEKSGVLSLAGYLRQVVVDHLENLEKKERN
jgi:hypothetical protein